MGWLTRACESGKSVERCESPLWITHRGGLEILHPPLEQDQALGHNSLPVLLPLSEEGSDEPLAGKKNKKTIGASTYQQD